MDEGRRERGEGRRQGRREGGRERGEGKKDGRGEGRWEGGKEKGRGKCLVSTLSITWSCKLIAIAWAISCSLNSDV